MAKCKCKCKYKLKLQIDGVYIHIHEHVLQIWHSRRQILDDGHEAFGVLIGSCSCDKKEYWIEGVTTPYPQDISSRYSFRLKDDKHQKAVDKAFDAAKGRAVYCGTWHTHPENNPVPSSIDIKDWKHCIARNIDRQLFFVIVGTEKLSIFVKKGKEFSVTTVNLDDIQ